MTLTPKQKQHLKAKAHALKPFVLLGQHGFTPAVQQELNQVLTDHELIKLRVPAADREQRQQLIKEICEISRAELVQTIGHVAILYRKTA